MRKYSVTELIENRCMQFDDSIRMGLSIYSLSGGDICEGCPKSMTKEVTCETLIALQKEDKAERVNSREFQKENYETVRQEAARRRVSIKQVRTERRDKT